MGLRPKEDRKQSPNAAGADLANEATAHLETASVDCRDAESPGCDPFTSRGASMSKSDFVRFVLLSLDPLTNLDACMMALVDELGRTGKTGVATLVSLMREYDIPPPSSFSQILQQRLPILQQPGLQSMSPC